MKCDVCHGKIDEHSHNGKVYWTEGHNAEPLVSGRCCDACNSLVIGFRMFAYSKHPHSIHYRLEIEKQREIQLKVAVMQRVDRERGEEE